MSLLESHRASGLLDLNVTEANLREEPADVAGPYVSGTRRRYRPAWRALNVCKSGLDMALTDYPGAVTHRRPEEVLSAG